MWNSIPLKLKFESISSALSFDHSSTTLEVDNKLSPLSVVPFPSNLEVDSLNARACVMFFSGLLVKFKF